jgi:hypothetical protein
MNVIHQLDRMINELEKSRTPPESIIMGKKYFYEWMIEITREGNISFNKNQKKYKFSYRDVPIVLCESEILEVVPNARYLIK